LDGFEMNENEKVNYEKIKERKKGLKWMMEKFMMSKSVTEMKIFMIFTK
jgi:hypothetical protein